MKCVLHIGSAKTATSSLQQLLYDNRKNLAAKGWLYPTTGLWRGDRSHNMLGIYFWDGLFDELKTTPFDRFLDTFFAEVEGWGNIIISSELIEKALARGNGRLPVLLDRLAAAGYEVQVVYVVRRQDHFLDSHFKQIVGDAYASYGGTVTDYVHSQAPGLDYAEIARGWEGASAVSRVSVMPFREASVRDVFVDVLESMGRHDLVSTGFDVPMVNPSLDGIFLRLKHYLNGFGLPIPLQQRFLAAATSPQARTAAPERLTLFTPESREAFLRQFDADTAELGSRYGVVFDPLAVSATNPAPLFHPLSANEIAPAMDCLRQVNSALATEIEAATSSEAIDPASA